VASDVPDRIAEGELRVVSVEMLNTGTESWEPGATWLGTTAPLDRASTLYHEQSWLGPNRPATVEQSTAPGEVGRFAFTIEAPEVDPDDGGEPDPPDGVDDVDDEAGDSALLGGCNTGGSAPPLWAAVLIVLALSRRSRRQGGRPSGICG
jgi:uncharacterized protein (TIGR03382 family)